jgi:hypothetical protein
MLVPGTAKATCAKGCLCQVLCRTSRFEMRGVGKNFDQQCADSWLSDDCWSVEGTGMPEIGPSELQIQVTPNSKPEMYSKYWP